MQVGEVVKYKGYITKYTFVRRRNAKQLETLIGYRAGSLGEGWALLFLNKLPGASDFEFRGYTHFLDGIPNNFSDLPDRKTCENMLLEDGVDLAKLKERIVKDVFKLRGTDRLVKVVPNKAMDKKAYKIGSGIPQWELTTKLPFKVAALIPPGGVNWVDASDVAE